MAKTPASKKRPAQARPPAKGGRPAGLFTWLAVGLVVLVVAGLVIIKVASGGAPNGSNSSSFQATDATTVAELTKVPTSVFNTVGTASPVAPVTPPQTLKGQPSLTATNTSGKKVPEILYIGAEYCPFCAAQRWPTIVALSRFGTWTGLGNMSSSSTDYAPNTPTFTFVNAKYTSPYLVFKSVEEFTNIPDAATSFYTALQKPSTQETALIAKYDTPKYVKGMTTSQVGSIPFITFSNEFLVSGASYSPTTLAGSTRSTIAAGLSNPTSPLTAAIIASANYQTAAICTVTKQQPSNVCTSPGVKAADKVMGLK
ncbi:MAG: DUF929 family protein [Acidimicrobiales bacterium]